jgi:Fe-S-cluster-containing dehydrogenase component
MHNIVSIILASQNYSNKKQETRYNMDELYLMVDLDRCINCGVCGIGCAIGKEEECPRKIFIRKKISNNNSSATASISLPHSCKNCVKPCSYYELYNYWIICPTESQSDYMDRENKSCDLCLERTDKGLWPSCATRCSMKAIYFGTIKELESALREKYTRGYGVLAM